AMLGRWPDAAESLPVWLELTAYYRHAGMHQDAESAIASAHRTLEAAGANATLARATNLTADEWVATFDPLQHPTRPGAPPEELPCNQCKPSACRPRRSEF